MGLVPLVVGLVEAVKRVGLPSRFAPLVSIGLGILGSFLIYQDPVQATINGILSGLSASGLYSGGRALLNSGAKK